MIDSLLLAFCYPWIPYFEATKKAEYINFLEEGERRIHFTVASVIYCPSTWYQCQRKKNIRGFSSDSTGCIFSRAVNYFLVYCKPCTRRESKSERRFLERGARRLCCTELGLNQAGLWTWVKIRPRASSWFLRWANRIFFRGDSNRGGASAILCYLPVWRLANFNVAPFCYFAPWRYIPCTRRMVIFACGETGCNHGLFRIRSSPCGAIVFHLLRNLLGCCTSNGGFRNRKSGENSVDKFQ